LLVTMRLRYQLYGKESMWRCWKLEREAGGSAPAESRAAMAGWLLEFTLLLIQVLVCTNWVFLQFLKQKSCLQFAYSCMA